MITESAINQWAGQGADVIDLLTGKTNFVQADTLVLATVNKADPTLCDELSKLQLKFSVIGDATAPRQAAYAIYEGRKVALAIE